MARKFIISDIHGLECFYKSVIGLIDNISMHEDVELYINGDLFDRGLESADILLDVKKRIDKNKYKIVYLGGNHELLMYEMYCDLSKGIYSPYNNWYDNGGSITDDVLMDLLGYDETEILKIVDFVANRDIYYKFNERINGKNIVLVHAKCPDIVKDRCDIKIKDHNNIVFTSVWFRKHMDFISEEINLGNKDYFTIIGHTPVNNDFGFEYNWLDNTLNIDGGCAYYAKGAFNYNHFPLIEVNDGFLKILTFNENNEIVYGNFFNGFLIPFSESELDDYRNYLNNEYKPKRLVRLPDGIIGYSDWWK